MPRFVVASRILRQLLQHRLVFDHGRRTVSRLPKRIAQRVPRLPHLRRGRRVPPRHTLTGLSHTMLRRIVKRAAHDQQQHKARRPCQRYSAGGRRRTFDRLRDRRGHDHRHSGTRHVHAMLGHPLAERDDAGRRSDAGEPPDRAEQVERRRPSRGIRRGEQRHETQRRENPQRIREGRDGVGLVHDRLTSRHDHHHEVAPDHDRLRQHVQDRRFRERGVNPRQRPNPVDEQAQRDHSDRDEHPHAVAFAWARDHPAAAASRGR